MVRLEAPGKAGWVWVGGMLMLFRRREEGLGRGEVPGGGRVSLV